VTDGFIYCCTFANGGGFDLGKPNLQDLYGTVQL
jgi:hypothetical protein